MLERVFISDLKNTLIYDDLPTELAKEIGVYKEKDQKIISPQEINSKINYPIIYMKDKRVARLQINDIFLNLVYSDISNFQASKALIDLKERILECVTVLNAESIKKNYFSIVKLLHQPFVQESSTKIYCKHKALIDIVAEVNCLIENQEVIYNNIYGSIFADQRIEDRVELVFEKNKALSFKSPFELELSNNAVKANCLLNSSTNIINYYEKDSTNVYIRATRGKDFITIESDCKDKFKFIEILIPVGKQTYKVETTASNGTNEFDITSGVIKWKLQDIFCKKETIKYKIFALEDEVVEDLVEIKFKIENPSTQDIRLVSFKTRDESKLTFWTRTTIQNGKYYVK